MDSQASKQLDQNFDKAIIITYEAAVQNQIKRQKQSINQPIADGWIVELIKNYKDQLKDLEIFQENIKICLQNVGFQKTYKDPSSLKNLFAKGMCHCCSKSGNIIQNICGHGCIKQCWNHQIARSIQNKTPIICNICNAPILYEVIQQVLDHSQQNYQKYLYSIVKGNRSYRRCCSSENCSYLLYLQKSKFDSEQIWKQEWDSHFQNEQCFFDKRKMDGLFTKKFMSTKNYLKIKEVLYQKNIYQCILSDQFQNILNQCSLIKMKYILNKISPRINSFIEDISGTKPSQEIANILTLYVKKMKQFFQKAITPQYAFVLKPASQYLQKHCNEQLNNSRIQKKKINCQIQIPQLYAQFNKCQLSNKKAKQYVKFKRRSSAHKQINKILQEKQEDTGIKKIMKHSNLTYFNIIKAEKTPISFSDLENLSKAKPMTLQIGVNKGFYAEGSQKLKQLLQKLGFKKYFCQMEEFQVEDQFIYEIFIPFKTIKQIKFIQKEQFLIFIDKASFQKHPENFESIFNGIHQYENQVFTCDELSQNKKQISEHICLISCKEISQVGKYLSKKFRAPKNQNCLIEKVRTELKITNIKQDFQKEMQSSFNLESLQNNVYKIKEEPKRTIELILKLRYDWKAKYQYVSEK